MRLGWWQMTECAGNVLSSQGLKLLDGSADYQFSQHRRGGYCGRTARGLHSCISDAGPLNTHGELDSIEAHFVSHITDPGWVFKLADVARVREVIGYLDAIH